MSYSNGINASAATMTKTRTGKDVCSFSGMCVTCLDGCPGMCEIGKSAVRSKEVLYPAPFGKTTSASQKEYPVDYSHFNIMGTAVGAHGVEADSNKAIFPAVNLESKVGNQHKIKLDLPIVVCAMGSTKVASENWDHLAAGCAIAGVGIIIGENVCAMDPHAEIKNGRVVKSPNLEKRVEDFQRWYNGQSGFISVQANVEDTNLGVHQYAIEKLGVEAVEMKWGQGAKDIGGEVKLSSLERAQQLYNRGYIVMPNPKDPKVQALFNVGAFKEFERHSRVGMVTEESFHNQVAALRSAGAKFISLKTGAYRPADLARAVKFASDAKLDMLTVDGAGGGTGMSPWRMMNEWGIPTVYIQSLLTKYLDKLAAQGRYIPAVVIAGGFTLEDHLYKAMAMGAPHIKAVGMARSPLTAAMVGKTVGEAIKTGKIPAEYKKYGETLEQIFVSASTLKDKMGDRFDQLPVGAIGVYSYFERLKQGLRQFMCGSRKFGLNYLERNDIAALTKEAAEITGIKYIMELDQQEAEQILS
ncbi:FMN-binding glutamate synthase family protein [Peptococcaceae bacterium 1198_IL3148]